MAETVSEATAPQAFDDSLIRVSSKQIGDTVLLYMEKEGDQMYMCGALHLKFMVQLVARSDSRFIDHTGVLRFVVETEDLLGASIIRTSASGSRTEEKIKREAPQEIRRRRLGSPVECGQRFLLKNVQYGLYLSVNQGKGGAENDYWEVELEEKVTPSCLFRVKNSADLKSPGAYMKYDFSMLLVCAASSDFSYSLSTRDSTICIQQEQVPWTFVKFMNSSDSDLFVKYLTPVRLKLK